MKSNLFLLLALFGAVIPTGSRAAITSTDVGLSSGGLTLKNFDDSTLLSGGTSAAGDGDVLQFGYYTAATTSHPFAGTFVALTGAGGLNSADATTSIGDLSSNGAGDGTFALNLTFTTGSVGLPSAGQIMAIRFYNSTSLATATDYGAVADTDALWESPSFPPSSVNFSLADPGVSWLGGNTAFTGTATTIAAAPEPNSMLLAICGFGLLAVVFKKRRASLVNPNR